MKADLVDADRLRPIITPEVGMHLEARWLSLAQQELFRQSTGYGSFTYPFLTDEAVRVCQPASRLMCPQDRDRPLMTGDGGESAHDGGRPSTRSCCWHCLATLTSLSLTRVISHSYAVGVSDSEAVKLGDTVVRRQSRRSSRHSSTLMDAEDTQKQNKIRELQAVVAKGLKGINECRFQTDCEFAHECPGTC